MSHNERLTLLAAALNNSALAFIIGVVVAPIESGQMAQPRLLLTLLGVGVGSDALILYAKPGS